MFKQDKPNWVVNFDLLDDTITADELVRIMLRKLDRLRDNHETECWPDARRVFYSSIFKASSEYLAKRLLLEPEKDAQIR